MGSGETSENYMQDIFEKAPWRKSSRYEMKTGRTFECEVWSRESKAREAKIGSLTFQKKINPTPLTTLTNARNPGEPREQADGKERLPVSHALPLCAKKDRRHRGHLCDSRWNSPDNAGGLKGK